ncbi:hypothetical protein MTBBW1_1010014 [Desulfamplus magnetovallimortis]|uniref:Uncharacterized protein n=1 Tax=Desulfamplus magnetovallimortis TaxID=1246637 RepID=A0A1W1H4T7_9BACT|nr:hypothetical protein MTBBW1_1010014 [Desulfamplus magnetovallimortis]
MADDQPPPTMEIVSISTVKIILLINWRLSFHDKYDFIFAGGKMEIPILYSASSG